ncbi:Hsp70 family protein, partial [Candidatus Woesebacteria bacterium]|nr:Hsp70 family protein [Candidatus Woesebacteria bacterium]
MSPVQACFKDAKLDPHDIDEVIMVGGMTRMPKIIEKVKDYFDKDPNQSVNPDEVVGVGAAIQGGVLAGDVKDVVLLDVTPLTLSIETLGGVSTPMIERNTTIPTTKKNVFSTAADNQTQVEVHVLQGERPMASDNKSLGRFILDGIPPSPRGVPQIEVSFDIDSSGILKVTAEDKASGKKQDITITGAIGLSDTEVERMKEEAEKHKAEDKKKAEKIEAKNKADGLVAAAEKALKDAGDKIDKSIKEGVEKKIDAVKELVKEDEPDKEKLEKATNELNDELQKVGQAMYAKQQAAESQKSKDKDQKEDKKESEEEDKKSSGKDEAEEGEVVEE